MRSKESMNTFEMAIYSAMIDKDLSKNQLAKEYGCKPQTITNWMKMHTNISVMQMLWLCHILDVDCYKMLSLYIKGRTEVFENA